MRPKGKTYAERLADKNTYRRMHPENGRLYNSQYKIEKRQFVDEYKMSRGCELCGYRGAPEALDFDHLPGFEKQIIVACLVNTTHSYKTLEAEMAKCRILCANCHRIVSRKQLLEANKIKREIKKLQKQLRMFED